MTLLAGGSLPFFKCVVAKSEAVPKNIFWVVDLELGSSTYQQKDEFLTRS